MHDRATAAASAEQPGVEQCQHAGTRCQTHAGGDEEGECADAATHQQTADGATKNTAHDGAGHHDREEQEDRHVGPVKAGGLARCVATLLLLWRRGKRQLFTGDARADLIDRGLQTTRVIVLAKAWSHGRVDDARCGQIGDCAFECLGHFDAHAPVVFGHQDDDAVADLLASDFPGVADAVRVRGDVFRCRGRHHQDHHLRTVFLLDRRELRFERLLGCGVQRAGLVDHMGAEGGHGQQLLRLHTGQTTTEQQERCKQCLQ